MTSHHNPHTCMTSTHEHISNSSLFTNAMAIEKSEKTKSRKVLVSSFNRRPQLKIPDEPLSLDLAVKNYKSVKEQKAGKCDKIETIETALSGGNNGKDTRGRKEKKQSKKADKTKKEKLGKRKLNVEIQKDEEIKEMPGAEPRKQVKTGNLSRGRSLKSPKSTSVSKSRKSVSLVEELTEENSTELSQQKIKSKGKITKKKVGKSRISQKKVKKTKKMALINREPNKEENTMELEPSKHDNGLYKENSQEIDGTTSSDLNNSWKAKLRSSNKAQTDVKVTAISEESVSQKIASTTPLELNSMDVIPALLDEKTKEDDKEVINNLIQDLPTGAKLNHDSDMDIELKNFDFRNFNLDATSLTTCSEHISEVTEVIQKTPIGKAHQVSLFPYRLNLKQKSLKKRSVKLVWNPELITQDTLSQYYERIEEVIGQKVENEANTIKSLMHFNMDFEKLLENIKKNKLYYQNNLCVEKRMLRSRKLL